jgi:hypothetical protein
MAWSGPPGDHRTETNKGTNVNIAARIAIAGGSVAGGALALHQLSGHIKPGLDADTRAAQAQTESARADWESWKRGVESEFPDLRLDTPTDHDAFEAYLQRNPAPSWIDVSHDQYNHVHLEASSPIGEDVERPVPETTGYPMAFGGIAAVAGAAVAVMSAFPGTRPASTGGAVAMALGGAAAIVGGGALALFSARGEANLDRVYGGAAELAREVDVAGRSSR